MASCKPTGCINLREVRRPVNFPQQRQATLSISITERGKSFHLSHASTPTLGPTQPHIQRVLGPRREADLVMRLRICGAIPLPMHLHSVDKNNLTFNFKTQRKCNTQI